MCLTKTSKLIHKVEHKKIEKLRVFEPLGYCRMKGISVPTLTGFALFLVLMNVKVYANLNLSISENATSSKTSKVNLEKIEVTAGSTNLAETTTKNSAHLESSTQYLQPFVTSAHPDGCNLVSEENFCIINCYGGLLEELPRDLENFQKLCEWGAGLKVAIKNYSLVGNTLKAEHLRGNFQAENLYFDSSTSTRISQIEAGAFDVESMATLHTLEMVDLNVAFLNESIFQGLSLQILHMTIQQNNFNGTRFLQPLANSLQQLVLQQTQNNTIFDPTNWLQGDRFPLLQLLQLSSNNFQNTLRAETFEMLDEIRRIYLTSCQITNIADGTFDAVAKTLKVLDLRNNQLKNLDANFLSHIDSEFTLELHGNAWDCNCENDQLINALKSLEIDYAYEIVCTTPEIFKNTPLVDLDLECTGGTTPPPLDSCSCVSKEDYCNINCFKGTLEELPRELEDLQKLCGWDKYLSVTVIDCSLDGNTLKGHHFKGNFQAESLHFDSTMGKRITQIEEGAFAVESMANLKTLTMQYLNVALLNERTFQGLSLQEFRMTFQPNNFNGSRFLAPFANSLQVLRLQQTEKNITFDPTNWLQGPPFSHLQYLHLSDNNFGNTLRGETFQMLDVITDIYLMRCEISNIAEGTFDAVAKTLKVLDLRANQLKTLDANFLSHIDSTFYLVLHDNEWNCTCENNQLIIALKRPEIFYMGEIVCTTPEILKNVPMTYLDLGCTTTAPPPFNTTKPPPITTTSLSPPPPTTPSSDKYLSLYCSSSSGRSSEEDNSITVRDCDAFFRIIAQTECNVTFAIESDMIDLQLIYFLPRNSTYVNVTNDELTSPYAGRTTEINVIGLTPQQLYVFCLVPKNEPKISPFNCLSFYLQTAHIPKPIWLSKSDIGWAISVFIIVLIATLCCGLVAVYFLLRCRPTWLCASKRIIRKGSKSREVYLIPKKCEEKEYTEGGDTYGNLDIKSCDYMQFHKELQDSKQNRTIHANAQMSPYEPAPTLPGKSQILSSTLPTIIRNIIENIDDAENDYQSII